MTQSTTHNPDLFMADLRQILSQGRKRIGLLIGAGAPVALKVDENGQLDDNGEPLIPDVERLTETVMDALARSDREVVDKFLPELGKKPNIEAILTRVRQLSQAIGNSKIHDLNGDGYKAMADRICQKIGCIVAPSLPDAPNPYTDLVSWIGGNCAASDYEQRVRVWTMGLVAAGYLLAEDQERVVANAIARYDIAAALPSRTAT